MCFLSLIESREIEIVKKRKKQKFFLYIMRVKMSFYLLLMNSKNIFNVFHWTKECMILLQKRNSTFIYLFLNFKKEKASKKFLNKGKNKLLKNKIIFLSFFFKSFNRSEFHLEFFFQQRKDDFTKQKL